MPHESVSLLSVLCIVEPVFIKIQKFGQGKLSSKGLPIVPPVHPLLILIRSDLNVCFAWCGLLVTVLFMNENE